ncbi:hypothetical protein [Sphingobacterium spiritivorum]|uniref:hypothetical protein n=1 Tax=Sphingobacterium spiritivorum TaxID=258 RepID=UPI001919C121|nr:hypothetical protein [Sphingobacterium spiritivorum]QQT26060.1 hypothetical protein I6J02_20530 [Sphingobacterium spiritivorum]
MKNTIIACFTFFIFLLSCTDEQEIAYNEKVSAEFYSNKMRFEEVQEKLASGYFDNSADIQILKDVKDLESKSELAVTSGKDINTLLISETAKPYHTQLLLYLDKIQLYYALTGEYISNTDTAARSQLMDRMNKVSKDVEDLHKKCLESQILFLNKAGLQHVPLQAK